MARAASTFLLVLLWLDAPIRARHLSSMAA